jgi:hypothetical protein
LKSTLKREQHAKLLAFYSVYEPISYYASSGTSPGRSGACGAAKIHHRLLLQTTPNQRHSGLFAAWHPLRYTSLFHREKPE